MMDAQDASEGHAETSSVIRFSERDFIRFLKILHASCPPSPALRQAMREYEGLCAAYPQNNL